MHIGSHLPSCRPVGRHQRLPFALTALVIGIGATFGVDTAQAMEIDTGSPDLKVSWGNTVRYNLGIRANGRANSIYSSANSDEGDAKFDRGDVVANRLDLLSELDVNYKRDLGLRLSAAAWGDFAYGDTASKTNPAYAALSSYNNSQYSSYIRKYYKGPGAELLDAYVSGAFNLGDVAANLRIGRQAVLWGEAVALSTHSVSYAQTPSDGLKGLATPGADAKEISLPVAQIFGSLQLSPTLTVAGQYFLEWKPTRIAEGGTYLGGTDFSLQGPDRIGTSPTTALINTGIVKPKGQGDWGLSARWSPAWADGTLGLYVRRFDERLPTFKRNLAGGTYGFLYTENAMLYGASYSTSIAGLSTGFEIVRREKTALNSVVTDPAGTEGARGNTWHLLANALAVVGPNGVWDQLTVIGELAFSHLEKVTSGAATFQGCANRPANDQGTETGCSTRNALQGFFRVTPSWVGVFPGWDVSALASLSLGLRGNSAVLGGGNFRAGSYSFGTTLTYNQRHDFSIAYNDYLATNSTNPNGTIRVSNGSQIQDRGWVSLTYKGSF